MTITIVGLGPGAWGQITLEAKSILEGAGEVYLRTERHPTVAHLPKHLALHSFDDLYEECQTFEAVYEAIVERLLALARRPQGVVYAVPGHPLVGEATVRAILARCQGEGIGAKVIPGMSFLEPALVALGIDPLSPGLQIVDALDPKLDPTIPTIVAQVYSQSIASSLKLALLELYPPQHQISLVTAAGVDGEEKVERLPLYALDRVPSVEHLTCLYLPPLTPEQSLGSFAALEHIIARLRGPGGCPWDREQTHASLKRYLTEEAYEVLQALDEGNTDKLCEELGDLLLQIVLHAQIASEAGQFEMRDVLRSINAKLLHRHPHVFGQSRVENAQEVAERWHELKQQERDDTSSLASVPKQMPALACSQSIQERAARLGFDWPELRGILEKLAEEVGELAKAETPRQRLEEFGDILFALANAARHLGVDPEEALRLANERFYRRFTYMEQACHQRGLDFSSLSFDAQNALWDEAKRNL